jgi:hypothetical protein
MPLSMQERSITRFGGLCSLGAGACFFLVVCCAFLSPESVISYEASDQYFSDFKSYRPIFVLLKWLLFFANLSMVGVACAFFSLRREKYHGLMTWITSVAIIGFGVGMLQSVQDLSMVPYLADQYAAGTPTVREVIIALGVANPALYILSLGLPGFWFLLVSARAMDNPEIPKHLVILGFLWGVGNLLTVIAHLFVIIRLLRLVTLGASVFAPMWSIAEGLYLLKLSRAAAVSDAAEERG